MNTTSEENLKIDMAVMKKDIEQIKDSLREVKELLVAQDLKYAQKNELTSLEESLRGELTIFKWAGAIVGGLVITYVFQQFLA